tara:strand:+ start:12366 stop:12665 length:300 start_codon:yes stop_codon:yes gene_type:complete
LASKAALPDECPFPLPWSLSKIAAVDAENCGKLGAAPALLFAGNMDIWADHAGTFDCGVADIAAPPVAFGGRLLGADGSFGACDELMLILEAPRPTITG